MASLFPVRKNGQFGYVNRKGEEVVAIKYLGATWFSDGLGWVRDKNGLRIVAADGSFCGAIANVDIASRFSSGAVTFSRGERWGVADEHGNELIVPSFPLVGSVVDGSLNVFQEDKWGVLRTDGEWLCKPKWEQLMPWASGGKVTSAVRDSTTLLVDKNGEPVSERKFAAGWTSAHGVVPVEFLDREGGGVGLVTESADALSARRFEASSDFASPDGIAVQESGGWGVVDLNCDFMCPPNFTWVGEESCGLRVAYFGGQREGYGLSGGKYGYIDSQGRILIEPKFDLARDFVDGIALAQLGIGKDCRRLLIDTDGQPIYESIG